ncbi:putative glutamate synthase Glt1 [Sesbania bispinosa]|nr:putative glutamate synthase Glt1 [Sesbania bispinosa]
MTKKAVKPLEVECRRGGRKIVWVVGRLTCGTLEILMEGLQVWQPVYGAVKCL